MKKRYICIITIIILLFGNILIVNADDFNLSSVIGGGNNFITSGAASSQDITGELSPIIKSLVSAGLGIGTIIAVCAGIVIAIQTMTDGANGKKELKEKLTPYVIACIVLFGGFAVWSAAVNVMEGVFGKTSPGGGTLTPSGVTPVVNPDVAAHTGNVNQQIHDALTKLSAVRDDDGYYYIKRSVLEKNTGSATYTTNKNSGNFTEIDTNANNPKDNSSGWYKVKINWK